VNEAFKPNDFPTIYDEPSCWFRAPDSCIGSAMDVTRQAYIAHRKADAHGADRIVKRTVSACGRTDDIKEHIRI
jgi:hypothetical protein